MSRGYAYLFIFRGIFMKTMNIYFALIITKNPEPAAYEQRVPVSVIYSRTQQLSQKCTFCGTDPFHRT